MVPLWKYFSGSKEEKAAILVLPLFFDRKRWGRRFSHHSLWKVLWMPGKERMEDGKREVWCPSWCPKLGTTMLKATSIVCMCPSRTDVLPCGCTVWENLPSVFSFQRCHCQDPLLPAFQLAHGQGQQADVPQAKHPINCHLGYLRLWGEEERTKLKTHLRVFCHAHRGKREEENSTMRSFGHLPLLIYRGRSSGLGVFCHRVLKVDF